MYDFVVVVSHVDQIFQTVSFFDSQYDAEKFAEYIIDPNREVAVYQRISD